MLRNLTRFLLVAAAVASMGVTAPTPAQAKPPTCLGQEPTIVGTDGDDVLSGTPGADVIVGLAGTDTIDGMAGNDVLCADSDEPTNTEQHDRVSGGSGDDRLRGTYGSTLDGQGGDDEFVSGADAYEGLRVTYADSPVGVRVDLQLGVADGWGHDTITGLVSPIVGSHHDDVLLGHDVDHEQCGQGGCETLIGLAGDDELLGRDGADSLVGGRGDDRLDGGGDRDGFLPGPGNDRISDSGDTHDTLSFWHAAHGIHVDVRAGTATGQGHDRFSGVEDVGGSNHADVIKGSHGINHMDGFGGPDRMYGRGRHDALSGDAGDDVLIGGPGPRDYAFGSVGTDVCEAEVTELCERSSR